MKKGAYDPRTIITPDAFSVEPALLGIPLARPMRRAFAVFLDLMAVGLITALTSGVWFILGVVIAAFFLSRATSRSGPATGTRRDFSKVFRVFLGCAGVGTLIITAVIFLGVRWLSSEGRGGMLQEQFADFIEEAEQEGGGDPVDLGRLAEDALSAVAPELATGDPEGDEAADGAAQASLPDPETLSFEEAVAAYDAWLAAGGRVAPGGSTYGAALEARIAGRIADDTISALEDRVRSALEAREDAEARLARNARGLTGWLLDRVDNVGFGLGWWAMYFAFLMPLLKGQTIGKRVAGVRVVRLDGEPITWWHAFERAGGYAAGFATGLMGFLQVYWDPNRQAIHDKIAGTVVILDGAEKRPGTWGTAEEPDPAPSPETPPTQQGA